MATAYYTKDYTFWWKQAEGTERDVRPLVELAVLNLRGYSPSAGGVVVARIREILRDQWTERNPATAPGHDAMGGMEGEQTDAHIKHEERMALSLPNYITRQYLLIDYNVAESTVPNGKGTNFEVSLLPIRSFNDSTYMARMPAAAFCGWAQMSEDNQRIFKDSPGRLEITRHVDAGSGHPKTVDRLDVTVSVEAMVARVTRHIRAVRQSGLGSDQLVVLVFWPHHENSMAMFLRDLITCTSDASLLNEDIKIINLAALMHWSPYLTTYTDIESLAEVAKVNSHPMERKNELEAQVHFMQHLLRLSTNPMEPSPPLRQLNDYLERAGNPKALGRYLGKYLARKILGSRTKTIASLRKWPSVTARLLTRYDVKCWFFLAISEDLRDDLLLLTTFGITRGIRDGWATEAGNRQLLALIGTPVYRDWLGKVRS